MQKVRKMLLLWKILIGNFQNKVQLYHDNNVLSFSLSFTTSFLFVTMVIKSQSVGVGVGGGGGVGGLEGGIIWVWAPRRYKYKSFQASWISRQLWLSFCLSETSTSWTTQMELAKMGELLYSLSIVMAMLKLRKDLGQKKQNQTSHVKKETLRLFFHLWKIVLPLPSFLYLKKLLPKMSRPWVAPRRTFRLTFSSLWFCLGDFNFGWLFFLDQSLSPIFLHIFFGVPHLATFISFLLTPSGVWTHNLSPLP